MMLWDALVLVLLGVGFGWLLRYASMRDRLGRQVIASEAESKKFSQFAAEMQKTDAFLQASRSHTDLNLFLRLEAGIVSEAKTLLIHKLGLFYHQWTSKPESTFHSDDIQQALSRIRDAAKDCKPLEEVLVYQPKNEPHAASR